MLYNIPLSNPTPNTVYFPLPHLYTVPPPLSSGKHQFVLYTCVAAPFFFKLYSLICCIFQIPHISDIICICFFLTYFTWDNALPHPSTFLQSSNFSFFFMAEQYSIAYINHIIFIRSSVDGTRRLLPYLGKKIFKQTCKTVKNYYFGELELKVMESFLFYFFQHCLHCSN